MGRHREKYSNDDYSPFAGPDYREHPGVSGKSRDGERWINEREREEQQSFIGKGPKGYVRSDDRIYEEVCERLLRSHELDASTVGVRVEEGIVTLEGTLPTRREKRIAETLIEDLPFVRDVQNRIRLSSEMSH